MSVRLIPYGRSVAVRVSGHPDASQNGTFYLHADHLGSHTVQTNRATGQKVAASEARFYPFGGYRTAPAEPLTGRGYTGHRHNDELGLIYMNARYYVPGIGRFASADTIVPDPANPQAFNRYSYVLNNPLKYTDPSGHCGADTTQKLTDQCAIERDALSALYEISFEGSWRLAEIRAVALALGDIRAGMGGLDYFKSKFKGTNLQRVNTDDGAFVDDLTNIVIGNDVFSGKEIDVSRFTIIHEFAHIWDARHLLGQSMGLESAMGTDTIGLGCETQLELVMSHCNYRTEKQVISEYSNTSRREDWADSFAATLYRGNMALIFDSHTHNVYENSSLMVSRTQYVEGQIHQARQAHNLMQANLSHYGYPSHTFMNYNPYIP